MPTQHIRHTGVPVVYLGLRLQIYCILYILMVYISILVFTSTQLVFWHACKTPTTKSIP